MFFFHCRDKYPPGIYEKSKPIWAESEKLYSKYVEKAKKDKKANKEEL